MYALNEIQIIGHLTEAPQLRQTGGGAAVTDLNIRVRSRVQRGDGSDVVISSYHTVTLWRGLAETVCEYCRAGAQVFVRGRLKTEEWETDGKKRRKTKIIGDDLIILDVRDETKAPQVDAESAEGCGVNLATVVGNLTRDPEVRDTASGQSVTSLGIATNRRWTDRTTNERREETEFHDVVVWGETGKQLAQVAKKGMRVFAAGRVQTRSWDSPEGEKRYATEITAETVRVLGHRDAEYAAGGGGGGSGAGMAAAAPAAGSSAAGGAAATAPAPEAELPTISYDSETKAEDLPF